MRPMAALKRPGKPGRLQALGNVEQRGNVQKTAGKEGKTE